MSYTPDDQLLQILLEEAADALDKLIPPVRARMKDSSEWKEEHLEELEILLHEALKFEAKLRRLASQIR
jgi:hypothetical protein